jgi:antitoxin (DNA-binding transcriptional repressor) of toxin-antitoxin stability system
MRHLNTHEAKTQLSALLAEVEESGEIFVICRNGRPVAELRPVVRGRDPLVSDPRVAGVLLHEDPVMPLGAD